MSFLVSLFEIVGIRKQNRHKLNYLASLENIKHSLEKEPNYIFANIDRIFVKVEKDIVNACDSGKIKFDEELNYEANLLSIIKDHLYDEIIFGGFVYRGVPDMTGKIQLAMYKKIVNSACLKGYCDKQTADDIINTLLEDIKNTG